MKTLILFLLPILSIAQIKKADTENAEFHFVIMDGQILKKISKSEQYLIDKGIYECDGQKIGALPYYIRFRDKEEELHTCYVIDRDTSNIRVLTYYAYNKVQSQGIKLIREQQFKIDVNIIFFLEEAWPPKKNMNEFFPIVK